MSEIAGAYYQTRAEDLLLGEVPGLLKGDPACLLMAGERPVAQVIAERFLAAVRPLEGYLLDGVHGVYEAEGAPLTMPEWRRIRMLPPMRSRLHVPEDYAAFQMVPSLLSVFPLRGGEIYLEALARPEVSQRMLRRASSANLQARAPSQEVAQAYLLARTTANNGRSCTAAYFNMLWADHVPATGVGRGYRRESLTIRYMGAPLLNKEAATLPPLAS